MYLIKILPIFVAFVFACSSEATNNQPKQDIGAGGQGECNQSCKDLEYDMDTIIQNNRACSSDADCKVVVLRCLTIGGGKDGQFGIGKNVDTSKLEASETELEACIKRTENFDDQGINRKCAQRALDWGVHCIDGVCRAGGGN